MLAAGLTNQSSDCASDAVEFAVGMFKIVNEMNQTFPDLPKGKKLGIRVGIHTGECVAGVVGLRRPVYDTWGSTVNIASRLESTGVANAIHISIETHEALNEQYKSLFHHREQLVEMKGVGQRQTLLYKPDILE
jgi:class 3 adenylate cyclase